MHLKKNRRFDNAGCFIGFIRWTTRGKSKEIGASGTCCVSAGYNGGWYCDRVVTGKTLVLLRERFSHAVTATVWLQVDDLLWAFSRARLLGYVLLRLVAYDTSRRQLIVSRGRDVVN